MQRFSVATSKGFIHTQDFESAMKVLQFEMERKRSQIEREKREQEALREEMLKWLDNYIPDNPQEAIQKKYEGGDNQ